MKRPSLGGSPDRSPSANNNIGFNMTLGEIEEEEDDEQQDDDTIKTDESMKEEHDQNERRESLLQENPTVL